MRQKCKYIALGLTTTLTACTGTATSLETAPSIEIFTTGCGD